MSTTLLFAAVLLLGGCESVGPVSPDDNCRGVSMSLRGPSAAHSSGWKDLGLGGEIDGIAVHPENPEVIFASIADKLFRSADDGQTWDTLSAGKHYFDGIQFDPNDASTLYARPRGIIKSTDGGQTWSRISDSIGVYQYRSVASLAINPANSNVLYAGTAGRFGGSLYKSADGGATWRELTGHKYLESGVISLAIDPAHTRTVYAGTAGRGDVLKSTDAGQTWRLTGLQETNTLIHDLLINPQSPGEIYAAYGELSRSRDGGDTWERFERGLPKQMEAVGLEGAGSLFLSATYKDTGGIYEWSPGDSTWIRIGIDALKQSYYYSVMEFSEANGKLYVGMENGLYVKDLGRGTGIDSPADPCAI